jgi:hypothetical protein
MIKGEVFTMYKAKPDHILNPNVAMPFFWKII